VITRVGKWFYAKHRPPGSRVPPRLGDKRYVGFMHAEKDGGAVLRGESSWRTISGFYVNHPRGFFTVQFRRFWR
jgi:hypothetical protein